MLVGAIAASRTGSAWFNFLTVATACVAPARGLLTVEYYKHKSSIVGNGAALGRWERWYAVGALAYGACLGSMCFVGFAVHRRPICHLLLNHPRGRIYGRNYGAQLQPAVDRNSQVSSILLPIALPVRFAADWSTWRCRGSCSRIFSPPSNFRDVFGRKSTALAARHWGKGRACSFACGTEFPI